MLPGNFTFFAECNRFETEANKENNNFYFRKSCHITLNLLVK